MEFTPQRWWAGALDVEQFASDAVMGAAKAVALLSASRGRDLAVGTNPALIAASFAALEHLRVGGRAPAGWAPFSGFVEASNGWVRLHGNYPHHAAAISRALEVSTTAQLHAAVHTMTAQAVEDAVVDAGGIAVVVRREKDWLAHPHGRVTESDPWIDVTLGVPRPPLDVADLPLHGVRVLDLTRVIAGPSCTQVLACLGADVVRIDPPDQPELLDHYLSNGMGKRSVELDLHVDLDAVRTDLLPHADVVVGGYRPGALHRFGLDPGSLQEDRPDLVIGSLSAWGERGPWSSRAGFDSIVQAATGIADVYAAADGRPGALPVQALDHATGYQLAAALIELLRTRHGGVVRASLLGAARHLLTMPRASHTEVVVVDVPTETVASPYGQLTVAALPFTIEHRAITAPVAGYGAAGPHFSTPATDR